MSKSFQEVTLFTVIGLSDQQQDGLTEMFVVATVAPSDSLHCSQTVTCVEMLSDITTPDCSTDELQLGVISRFTMMLDPGPPAAWRPAPSLAGL